MKPEEFWDLTWYDWGLYVLKHQTALERNVMMQESNLVVWRAWMALYANSVRDSKKQPIPFEPTDFFKLSFDDVKKEPLILSEKQMKEKFGKTFKKDGN